MEYLVAFAVAIAVGTVAEALSPPFRSGVRHLTVGSFRGVCAAFGSEELRRGFSAMTAEPAAWTSRSTRRSL